MVVAANVTVHSVVARGDDHLFKNSYTMVSNNAETIKLFLPHYGLHYGNYRSKLVPFEEQKNIFYILKRL
jgi:hypothetical protein